MFGDIVIKSRPLRFAFLIPPENAMLRTVMQTNCTLWGGVYNPIIPIYARAPKRWKSFPNERISLNKRILGYIRAFDPDFLVDCMPNGLPGYLDDSQRRTIKLDDLTNLGADLRLPRYGVGIFELLAAFYEEYFEIVRRFPIKIALPTFPAEHELFWGAVAGSFPSKVVTLCKSDYSEAIDFEEIKIDPISYIDRSKSLVLPRDVVRFHLRLEQSGWRRGDALAFYMDADRFMDIVDFWNLRALGRRILAIPKQFIAISEYLDFFRRYVHDSYRVSRHNPSITYGTTLVRSFNSTMPDLEQLAKTLQLEKEFPEGVPPRPMILQHWYPRIWDEWAVEKDDATPDSLSCTTETFSFPDTNGTVSLKVVKPDFETEPSFDGPGYANDIYPKFYGTETGIRAEVLPYDHGEAVLRAAAGPMSLADQIRIGRAGLVRFVGWDSDMRWRVPPAEDIFFAWLKDKGFEAKLSTCGQLAKEIYAQLGGWLAVLTREPVLKLINKMNQGGDDGRGMPLGRVKNELKAIDPSGRLYRSLVDRMVFQLGYRTQCIHCHRMSWYDVDAFGAQLTCPLCYKTLDAINAVDSDSKGEWFLKTAGGFGVGNYADGAFSVLLTLNFFKRGQSLRTTPVFSFTAVDKQAAVSLEVDFGLLWQEIAFGEAHEGILLAECKSYNKFEKRDFDRARSLAEKFPGAILAFCTFRRQLTPGELRAIKSIARSGRRYWKADRPINPVLVLTGTELFSPAGPPYCWENIAAPEWANRAHSLLEICSATQTIHLGLEHWQEAWMQDFDKRRRKRKTSAHKK